jgi:hypothetical protein
MDADTIAGVEGGDPLPLLASLDAVDNTAH